MIVFVRAEVEGSGEGGIARGNTTRKLKIFSVNDGEHSPKSTPLPPLPVSKRPLARNVELERIFFSVGI